MRGFIDIGANLAQEYFAEPNRDQIEWMFFEPQRSVFNEMCKKLILPKDNIKVFNLALGDKIGEVEMFVAKYNDCQSSSILPPKIHLTQYPGVVFDSKEIVKIDKLDNIEYDKSLYDSMHIDTQGTELQVLQGAIGSIKYINEITVEVNRAELYEGCPMIEDITAFLLTHGFSLQSVDWMGKSWGDALYLKR